jgi:hypothetical protein
MSDLSPYIHGFFWMVGIYVTAGFLWEAIVKFFTSAAEQNERENAKPWRDTNDSP